jgi:hypothetical protein
MIPADSLPPSVAHKCPPASAIYCYVQDCMFQILVPDKNRPRNELRPRNAVGPIVSIASQCTCRGPGPSVRPKPRLGLGTRQGLAKDAIRLFKLQLGAVANIAGNSPRPSRPFETPRRAAFSTMSPLCSNFLHGTLYVSPRADYGIANFRHKVPRGGLYSKLWNHSPARRTTVGL